MTYLAHGKVDFFGDEAMARTRGAGGPAWTERPPIHFGIRPNPIIEGLYLRGRV
jgi:hypothetical protein